MSVYLCYPIPYKHTLAMQQILVLCDITVLTQKLEDEEGYYTTVEKVRTRFYELTKQFSMTEQHNSQPGTIRRECKHHEMLAEVSLAVCCHPLNTKESFTIYYLKFIQFFSIAEFCMVLNSLEMLYYLTLSSSQHC